ncbi:hypothetical protein EJB05_00270, partial [Eragrostis curvula]
MFGFLLVPLYFLSHISLRLRDRVRPGGQAKVREIEGGGEVERLRDRVRPGGGEVWRRRTLASAVEGCTRRVSAAMASICRKPACSAAIRSSAAIRLQFQWCIASLNPLLVQDLSSSPSSRFVVFVEFDISVLGDVFPGDLTLLGVLLRRGLYLKCSYGCSQPLKRRCHCHVANNLKVRFMSPAS